jgi:hypothetical protein
MISSEARSATVAEGMLIKTRSIFNIAEQLSRQFIDELVDRAKRIYAKPEEIRA